VKSAGCSFQETVDYVEKKRKSIMIKEVELSIEQVIEMLPPNKMDAESIVKNLLIYTKGKYDILPDILLAMTPEQVINFVYIFSDKTLKIPEYRLFSNSIRDIMIFQAIQKDPQHKTVKELAEKYELTVQATLWIVEKVSSKLEVPNPLKN
jgi:hypothetical protein